VNRSSTVATTLAVACVLSACSSVDGFLQGDKLDYRSQAGKTSPLEVPPDLSQLSRDSRYQPQAGSVSASTLQAAAPATAAVAAVAPQAIGDMRIERAGNERWLVTQLTPDQLWPQLVTFWQERGFTLATQDAEAGVMETDWAENRAKLPQDIIRNTIGKVLEGLYSTGERDRFRTRVERTPNGSEVYISHKRLEEVFTSPQRDKTRWTQAPADPQLEAELLTRLMVKLGVKEDVARRTVATPTNQPARARLVNAQAAALQVDEPFDRAWRRVGLALDRSGFTVEDRDRAGGLYYVRYIDPKTIPKEDDSGFMSKLRGVFGGGKQDASNPANRYRISVKGEGDRTTVAVLDAQGAPENSDVGKRIVALLVEDLK
jgi:outer membrane protein assembly factor BamC